METLQWTLLVGLLGMVVYVLWARLKASFAKGTAPKVDADWEGEAVEIFPETLKVRVNVKHSGDVRVWLESGTGEQHILHDDFLDVGLHSWDMKRPQEGEWVAKLSCQGHRSERRFRL